VFCFIGLSITECCLEFFADVVFVALLTVSRDHFTDESGKE